jgi:phosphate/sulfate permease
MIQRIQTIFLFLAAGLLGALLAVPFLSVGTGAEYAATSILGDQVFNLQDHMALIVLFLLSAGLALISIFLFKKRPLQMTFTLISTLINVAGIGFAAYLLYQSGAFDQGGLQVQAGIAFPVLAIIFSLLAYRSIKKDENTVQSSYSRLR